MGIRAAVLGIGNLLLMDEGAGVHAANALRELFVFPGDDVLVVDGGTMGLDLLPYIEGRDCLVILDAVDFGAEPGTVGTIEEEDIGAFLDLKFSVHQIGVRDMLFAAELSGVRPGKTCLVGIQPHRVEAGLGLSEAVAPRIGGMVDAAVARLRAWGVEVRADVPCDTV